MHPNILSLNQALRKLSGIKWLVMNLGSASPVQNYIYRTLIANVSGWCEGSFDPRGHLSRGVICPLLGSMYVMHTFPLFEVQINSEIMNENRQINNQKLIEILVEQEWNLPRWHLYQSVYYSPTHPPLNPRLCATARKANEYHWNCFRVCQPSC